MGDARASAGGLDAAAPPSACPCGSGLASCCAARLDGTAPAATAEELMRSRYVAFVRGDAEYLAATQQKPTTEDGRRALRDWALGVTWLGLEVRAVEAGGAGDEAGGVSFAARYLEDGAVVTLAEAARFTRRGRRWVYVDGELEVRRVKLERNAPCPCGSGKKAKACHGR